MKTTEKIVVALLVLAILMSLISVSLSLSLGEFKNMETKPRVNVIQTIRIDGEENTGVSLNILGRGGQ